MLLHKLRPHAAKLCGPAVASLLNHYRLAEYLGGNGHGGEPLRNAAMIVRRPHWGINAVELGSQMALVCSRSRHRLCLSQVNAWRPSKLLELQSHAVDKLSFTYPLKPTRYNAIPSLNAGGPTVWILMRTAAHRNPALGLAVDFILISAGH